MKRSAKNLRYYTVVGRSGAIGYVRRFYFNPWKWRIRYLVLAGTAPGESENSAATAAAPGDLHVLPKVPFFDVDVQERRIYLDLEPTVVSASPKIEGRSPFSSGVAARCDEYYRRQGVGEERFQTERPAAPPPGLRTAEEILECRVETRDGELGRISDLVMDDDTWQVSYLVVETGNTGRRNVIINPHWADEVDWKNRVVHLDLRTDVVERMSEI